jgi:nucleotide-binding universal stress UspA family protein
MEALDIDLVLVPVDGSEESTTAVEYAVAIAAEYDATVHTVYVLGEDVVRAIETGVVDEEEVAAETEAFTATAGEIAETHDVELTTSTAYGFSTRVKTRHPGSVVLDTAEDIEADFVVVPREPVSGDPGEVLEKAAEYVLLYATQPVLSV